ncbi:MAG: hypothetical protein AB7N80_09645 [Bdellovibrionales bacterium]
MNLPLALGLKNVHLLWRRDWRAQEQNHRPILRAAALESLRELAQSKTPAVSLPANLKDVFQDLKKPPQVTGFTVSISHCPLAGGFAVAFSDEGQLGFDLENAAQVTPEIALRVSSKQELEQAPSPACLWTAKEATFKSLLGPAQPLVLSAIHLHNWHVLERGVWLFSAEIQQLKAARIRGILKQENDLIVGLSQFSA